MYFFLTDDSREDETSWTDSKSWFNLITCMSINDLIFNWKFTTCNCTGWTGWFSFYIKIQNKIMWMTLFLFLVTAERENTDSSSGSWWLPYLFICFGVLILILTVMLISILCINEFKSKSLCHFPLRCLHFGMILTCI